MSTAQVIGMVAVTTTAILAPPVWLSWTAWRGRRPGWPGVLSAASWWTTAWFAGAWAALGYATRSVLAVVSVVVLAACMAALVRPRARPRATPSGGRRRVAAVFALASLALALAATSAQLEPSIEAASLAFPFKGARYAVIQGGNGVIGNGAHRRIAAQHHALDLVRIDGALGVRARGIVPAARGDYATFGEPVYSPCTGRVARAVDGRRDHGPGEPEQPAGGNWVWIECDGFLVALQHLRRGTVSMREGENVTRGDRIGEVGNSGWSLEPHVHLDVVRHRAGDPLPTDPRLVPGVPVRFEDRILAINDVVDARAKP